jgi:hypothetical protein
MNEIFSPTKCIFSLYIKGEIREPTIDDTHSVRTA